MKRMHMHVAVDDLAKSISFYSTLFDASPAVVESDYAKWMLDDPRVNLAISARGRVAGVDHLGIQVESPDELAALSGRLKAAGEITIDQEAAACCYARSDKSWVNDPAGLRWETFFTFEAETSYGEDEVDAKTTGEACCTPVTPQGVCCPPKAELAPAAPCCGVPA